MSKDPKNNKIRLVYMIGKNGEPISDIALEHSEAQKILKILRYLQKKNQGENKDKWVYVAQIVKDLKMTQYSEILRVHLTTVIIVITLSEDMVTLLQLIRN